MFVHRLLVDRLALTIAEAQDLLQCPVEMVLAYVPEHWCERYGGNTIPIVAVEDLARMLRIPCYE
jgi:hypothetical protein